MSRFTGPLRVEMSPVNGRQVKLLEALVWELDRKGSGRVIRVPAGFISDGVTVPRIFWSFLPPWGHPASRAAVLHDFLLTRQPMERRRADRQFYLALRAVGVSRPGAWVLWAAVRVFGIAKMTWLRLRPIFAMISHR